MNRSDELKKSIKQKIKALERNKVDLLNDEVSFENQVMRYASKIKDINYNRTYIDKRIIKIIDKINLI